MTIKQWRKGIPFKQKSVGKDSEAGKNLVPSKNWNKTHKTEAWELRRGTGKDVTAGRGRGQILGGLSPC